MSKLVVESEFPSPIVFPLTYIYGNPFVLLSNFTPKTRAHTVDTHAFCGNPFFLFSPSHPPYSEAQTYWPYLLNWILRCVHQFELLLKQLVGSQDSIQASKDWVVSRLGHYAVAIAWRLRAFSKETEVAAGGEGPRALPRNKVSSRAPSSLFPHQAYHCLMSYPLTLMELASYLYQTIEGFFLVSGGVHCNAGLHTPWRRAVYSSISMAFWFSKTLRNYV